MTTAPPADATYPALPCPVVGDKPELAYPEAAAELAELGHSSTLGYLQQAAGEVLAQTGLLPHINAGRPGRERRLPSRQLAAASSCAGCFPEHISRVDSWPPRAVQA